MADSGRMFHVKQVFALVKFPEPCWRWSGEFTDAVRNIRFFNSGVDLIVRTSGIHYLMLVFLKGSRACRVLCAETMWGYS